MKQRTVGWRGFILIGLTGVALVFLLGFIFGVAAGAAYPEAPLSPLFLDGLAAAGGWVAGIGAFAAAAVALWLDEGRRRDDAPSLKVVQDYHQEEGWTAQLISAGRRPIRIAGLKLVAGDPQLYASLPPRMFKEYPLPATISYAESIQLKMDHNFNYHFLHASERITTSERVRDLRLVVITTLSEESYELPAELLRWLRERLGKNEAQIQELRKQGFFGGTLDD